MSGVKRGPLYTLWAYHKYEEERILVREPLPGSGSGCWRQKTGGRQDSAADFDNGNAHRDRLLVDRSG
jgi:hypothetical protein